MAVNNSIALKMITDAADSFTLNIRNADGALLETPEALGQAVKDVYDKIIAIQPFEVNIASLESAIFTVTTATEINIPV